LIPLALPAGEAERVIPRQSASEANTLRAVRELAKAVNLIIVAPSWKTLKLVFERRRPRSVLREEDRAGTALDSNLQYGLVLFPLLAVSSLVIGMIRSVVAPHVRRPRPVSFGKSSS
jgi:hypothetical protein